MNNHTMELGNRDIVPDISRVICDTIISHKNDMYANKTVSGQRGTSTRIHPVNVDSHNYAIEAVFAVNDEEIQDKYKMYGNEFDNFDCDFTINGKNTVGRLFSSPIIRRSEIKLLLSQSPKNETEVILNKSVYIGQYIVDNSVEYPLKITFRKCKGGGLIIYKLTVTFPKDIGDKWFEMFLMHNYQKEVVFEARMK